MSKRTHILKALAEKLKLIDGTGIFKTNISNNSYPKLNSGMKFKIFHVYILLLVQKQETITQVDLLGRTC